jgi:predicted PurR-regulated permease PerM
VEGPSQPEAVAVGDPAAAAADPPRKMTGREAMPVWVPRAITLFFVGLAMTYVIFWTLLELQGFLLIILVSLFLSFALEPAVDRLANRGMRRGAATGLVMVGCVVALFGFIGLLGQALFTQISEFAEDLPARIESAETSINDRFDTNLDFDELIESYQEKDLSGDASKLAENAVDLGVTAVGALFQMFTIALFTFYMVADGPRFRRSVLSFLPQARQTQVYEGWELAIEKTGGYIYSRGLLALLSAVSTSLALWLIGVPYWFALGLWVGLVSQFIPTVGTYLAGALPVLVALLEDPTDAVIVLVFIVVYQQVENYLFSPKITARTMDLHPAVAFGTVMVGGSLFGGTGALLALPAAALIQAIGSTYLNRHEVIDAQLTRDATPRPPRPDGWRSRFGRRVTGDVIAETDASVAATASKHEPSSPD